MKPGFKLYVILLFCLAFIYSIRPINYASDFRAYYLAGKRMVAKTFNLTITLPKELTAQENFYPHESIYSEADYLSYKYTPVVTYLFVPFSFLPLRVAEFFWLHFSLGFFILSLYLIYKNFKNDFFTDPKKTFYFFSILTILMLGLVVRELKFLQVNFITLFCLTGFLHFRKTKENLAAFLLAFSVCIKIFPIFFLIFLLVEKEYRLILKILGAGIFLAILPIITYGGSLFEEYLNYLKFMTNGQHLFPADAEYNIISIDSFIVRFFMERPFWKNYSTNIFSLSPNQTFWIILSLKGFFLALLINAQKKLKKLATNPKNLKFYNWVMMGLYANFFSLINPLAWRFALVILIFSWVPILLLKLDGQKMDRREVVLFISSLILLVFPTDIFGKTFKIIYISKFSPPLLGTICLSFLLYSVARKHLKKMPR